MALDENGTDVADGVDVSVLLLRADDPEFSTLQPLLEPLLADHEREEFDRIRSPAARGRRIACRGWLRWWLGGLLDIAPARVPLLRTASGRIELASGPPGFFNVAQSDGLVAIALLDPTAWRAPMQLGVDVEAMQRRWSPDLAAALFGEQELAWLMARPEVERDAAFLSLWALREAVIKADGRGLSLDLGALRFAPEDRPPWRPADCAGLVRLNPSALVEPSQWACWLRQSDYAACAVALHCEELPPLLRISIRTVGEGDAACALHAPLTAVGMNDPVTRPLFVAAQRH
jgi:4'-phosphopantetheinyl transferase